MAETKKKQVDNAKKEETVEEVKAVDDEPVQEGTDVKIDEVEEVKEGDTEACEAAKPKPVPK